MELRQLEYFQLASRLHNVTRVAERLGVSQPNVTVAIKKLEEELGIQLFDRRRKQLSLTAEGEVFLSRIEPALQDIQGAVQEINDYKQMEKWSLKIGISPMIGAYLAPRLLPSFRRDYQFRVINSNKHFREVTLHEQRSYNIKHTLYAHIISLCPTASL